MFKVTNEEIEQLIQKEIEGAKEYPNYHSDHEFYSVLKEEIEEAEEKYTEMKIFLNEIWFKIRGRDCDDTHIDFHAENVYNTSIKAIKELLQVCAVCEKYLYK